MPNPNGGFLQANAGYTWANGDVYEIVQTDTNEGAASGASFGGLGVENQPHQVLLNKINYTHSHQVTDEDNIVVLQNFKGLFRSGVGVNGWYAIGVGDSSLGQIEVIEQWGLVSSGPIGSIIFNFPILFPHQAFNVVGNVQAFTGTAQPVTTWAGTTVNENGSGNWIVTAAPVSTAQGQVIVWDPIVNRGVSGAAVYWRAVGY